MQSASVTVVKTKELPLFANLFKKYLSDSDQAINTEQWLQYDQENVDILFDLGNFVNHLEKHQPAKELSKQLRELIVSYNHTKYFFNKIPLEQSTGISIYLPKKTNIKNEEYAFYQALLWSNAIDMPNFINTKL